MPISVCENKHQNHPNRCLCLSSGMDTIIGNTKPKITYVTVSAYHQEWLQSSVTLRLRSLMSLFVLIIRNGHKLQ